MALPPSSQRPRVHVRGFLKRHPELVSSRIDGQVAAPLSVTGVAPWSQPRTQKTAVFIAKAPRHRAQALITPMPKWVKKGLMVKALPSSAPACTLIEIVWRFMQEYWLPLSAYASFQRVSEAVAEILTRIGTDYTINFQAA